MDFENMKKAIREYKLAGLYLLTIASTSAAVFNGYINRNILVLIIGIMLGFQIPLFLLGNKIKREEQSKNKAENTNKLAEDIKNLK